MQIPSHDLSEFFGAPTRIDSIPDIVLFVQHRGRDLNACRGAALCAMVMAAFAQARPASYFADALEALNEIGRAKLALDAAVCHMLDVVTATGELMLSAQRYVDEMTIPCTEWPSTRELADHVYLEACRLAGFKR